jgi:hypothetical protein
MGPENAPGKILKLGREAMIPYFAWLLDITMNNATIPSDWKKSQSGFYLQGERSIHSHKLQTSQLNLSVLQANGTHYSRIPKENLGYE